MQWKVEVAVPNVGDAARGARESTKRAFIGVAIALVLLANSEANAVVVHRLSNTLRDSVFQQTMWAIAKLGLGGGFRHSAPG